jgi:phospholipid transport system substrate-binding protein
MSFLSARSPVTLYGRRMFLAGLATLFAILATPVPALADSVAPRQVVEDYLVVLRQVMADGPRLGFRGRFDRLQPAFERTFNAPHMARVVVGPNWDSMNAGDQQRIVDSFTRFSVASYASNFADSSGEKLEVTGERPAPNNQGTIVESRIVLSSGEAVRIDYYLRDYNGTWKVLDVFLKGQISELSTRRSDFSAIIRQEGASGLVARLEAKVTELASRTKG